MWDSAALAASGGECFVSWREKKERKKGRREVGWCQMGVLPKADWMFVARNALACRKARVLFFIGCHLPLGHKPHRINFLEVAYCRMGKWTSANALKRFTFIKGMWIKKQVCRGHRTQSRKQSANDNLIVGDRRMFSASTTAIVKQRRPTCAIVEACIASQIHINHVRLQVTNSL